MKWFNTLSHNRWLEQETDRIFDFGKTPPCRPALAGWAITAVRSDMGTHLWITARMLHVYAVAANMGRPGRMPWLSTALMPSTARCATNSTAAGTPV